MDDGNFHSEASTPTQPEGNSASRTSATTGVVRDGRIGAYGYIFLDELDTPEFRALTPRAVRVLMVLWSMAAKGTDECFPGQARLANITGVSRGRVSRAITELETAGFLEKLPHRGRSLKYRMLRPPSNR